MPPRFATKGGLLKFLLEFLHWFDPTPQPPPLKQRGGGDWIGAFMFYWLAFLRKRPFLSTISNLLESNQVDYH